MELDFDKYCKLSGSPNTVLPPPHPRSKIEKRRSTKRDPSRKSDLFTLEEDLVEINFQQFRSISCKNIQARASGLGRNEILRRGSVYQSSTERRNLEKVEEFEGRKKIELSGKDSIFSTIGIVDSLCSSDEDSSISESSVIAKNSESSSEKMLDLPFEFGKENIVLLDRAKIENSQVRESFRETSISLHKSLSTKSAKPHMPSQSESDSSRPSSPKARFSPIRKMFDPFTKSKSMRSPLDHSSDSIKKHDAFRKSLLSDFSKAPKSQEIVPRESSVSCSPTHLHGCLKLETKYGSPIFEFSLKSPEEVLVARRWKTKNCLNWVYTFHSFPNRIKSNVTTQWELKDLKKAQSLVAQMQVSSNLHTEIKNEGAFGNFIITEFVLHDVTKPKDFNSSAQKSLEMAAAVIQIPYEKRESLKHKAGDRSLLDLCGAEERKDLELRVNFVVPLGTHGMPDADVASCGPSSLIDRWRSEGACDCGGWDMGCPLSVFGNSDIRSADNRLVLENRQPLELYAKGCKENTPAFLITSVDEGRYLIDFHAKLSSLQAFSMCVAILHCTEEVSIIDTHERKNLLSKSDSLRVFVEEDISDLVESVTEDEKKAEIKKIEEMKPSFKINPPFSPIARV